MSNKSLSFYCCLSGIFNKLVNSLSPCFSGSIYHPLHRPFLVPFVFMRVAESCHGTTGILFQRRGKDCQLAESLSSGARGRKHHLQWQATRISSVGEERTFHFVFLLLRVLGGNYHSWHLRELKFNLRDLQSLRTFSPQSHHLSKWIEEE